MQPAIHFADSPQIPKTSIPSKHKRFEYMTVVRAGLENRSPQLEIFDQNLPRQFLLLTSQAAAFRSIYKYNYLFLFGLSIFL
ncbi:MULTISPECIES: hypothetical protein [Chroococcidiopsis]|uniref:hypothetical protein n=1 Tax=Chroococcidiopsis TaxID=54298 RepID=UPI00059C3BBB|nr:MULTISPECIES: hypothetical protein [Chroococcidiopsis]MBE9018468.1 hypothetical protein [Chroococcidiopsidales cyanobacterium LEGE 13417]PSB44677.1 hypothetical protein C7B80_19770 [Cyanosarcina cf. burmensis CCALA 770]PSM51027.1 hypothetical protein C7Y66_00615 [Chroococcidiopsis sp. CCALA 051]